MLEEVVQGQVGILPKVAEKLGYRILRQSSYLPVEVRWL